VPDEVSRLRALHGLEVLDSAPEEEFEALVRVASLVCGVPISLVSLVDRDRQWFKANAGLTGVSETPRDVAFCAHAIHGDDILEIPDATVDPRFAGNPLVTGRPDIRFYAGAPLRLSDGARVGTLCVIDRMPRRLEAHQREILGQLAAVASHALEGRIARISERRLLADASRAAALVRFSLDAIIATTLDGTVTHWNPGAGRLYGYGEQEMVGRPVDCILAEHRRASEGRLAAALEAQPLGATYDTLHRHRDGKLMPVSVALAPMTGTDGTLLGATMVVRDIRKETQAVQALADHQALLQRIYQSTPANLHSTDPRGKVLTVSDRWLETLGYERGEVVGRRASDFLTEASKARIATEVTPAMIAAGRCDRVPLEALTKSGRLVEVLLSMHAEVDESGTQVRRMSVLEDVTERNAARRISDALMHALRSRFILSMTDVKSTIIDVNDAFCEISGYRREELLGANHRIVNSGHHPKSFFEDMYRTIARGDSWRGDICNRARDGSLYWVDSTIVPLLGANGRVERYLMVRVDITERKRQEEALARSERFVHAITDSLPGLVAYWDKELRCRFANRAY
jgi:PAS domain S-box-containing protein